jgi:hypothetical protein
VNVQAHVTIGVQCTGRPSVPEDVTQKTAELYVLNVYVGVTKDPNVFENSMRVVQLDISSFGTLLYLRSIESITSHFHAK